MSAFIQLFRLCSYLNKLSSQLYIFSLSKILLTMVVSCKMLFAEHSNSHKITLCVNCVIYALHNYISFSIQHSIL